MDQAPINDGGPAAPTLERDEAGRLVVTHTGLSLRDYFASMALQGMLASGHQDAIESTVIASGGKPADGLAAASYGFADAMISARSPAVSA